MLILASNSQENGMRIAALALSLLSTVAFAQETILGFSESDSLAQQELETAFDKEINSAELDEWLQLLSSEPHHVGTRKGLENVKFIADKFRSWGFDTEIVEYEVLFPSPKTRELELVYPTRYTATLEEDS
ncbi:MAG: N-acetylated-alpha-linked acidic dipeptidase, partial [Pseudohongiellaceae bacterium]